jgi:four helix bundle protein
MVSDHSQLECYQLCEELCRMVREITECPNFKDERLKAQLRDAADSPCPNIGEGFSR